MGCDGQRVSRLDFSSNSWGFMCNLSSGFLTSWSIVLRSDFSSIIGSEADEQLCYDQIFFSIMGYGGKYCVKIRFFFNHGPVIGNMSRSEFSPIIGCDVHLC